MIVVGADYELEIGVITQHLSSIIIYQQPEISITNHQSSVVVVVRVGISCYFWCCFVCYYLLCEVFQSIFPLLVPHSLLLHVSSPLHLHHLGPSHCFLVLLLDMAFVNLIVTS